MPSLKSRLTELLLLALRKKATGRVSLFEHADKPAVPTTAMRTRYSITERMVNTRTVYTLGPKPDRDGARTDKHILYLHGGSYIYPIKKQHWRFIGKLIDALQCLVTVPDYGLAPTHTMDEAFDLVVAVYRDLVATSDPQGITIMGDSSGGGMSLGVAQVLRQHGLPQPSHLVLLSPWLDVTLDNPAIALVDPLDPFLSISQLRTAGRAYAGKHDLRDPRVSPIFGPIDGLAPITLFIGTHDIFVADARTFHDRALAAGVPIDYHEAAEMIHVWMLLDLPESEPVLNHIIKELGAEPR